ncbi:interferon-induced protein 44-like isoform X1 [Etheostoma cragini]|uniref:interferon-induced protein 44-like isoform X1 n=1 Tax=Etheostoma cragini TaxID=417921 RepID=UPI00155ED058|nr:interferon-induced protein 44-like isoform X1 [Etheostoma cragini]
MQENISKVGIFGGFSFDTPKLLPTAPSTSAKPAVSMSAGAKDAISTLTDNSLTEKREKKPLFTFPGALAKPAISPAAGAKDALSTVTDVSLTERMETKPLFAFPAAQQKLESQWRDMEWTEEQKTSLMKTISSYRPICHEVTQVLLLGPVGSGKSSFISSVQSVFNGRVTNRAMVGSSLTSFTKKLQSFHIHSQKGKDPTGLVLCDVVGLGGGEMTGLTLYDILSVIKGHVPEGHKFSPDQPVRSETVGYVKKPSLKDKIHCVAFVVDASKVLTYPKGFSSTFQQLREHISELGVHQVALLTHVDQICPETANDVAKVYKSHIIREMMSKAGALLGMSTSYIVPVKNYSSELDLDASTDVLLLSAVDHILQYAELYFQDNIPQHTGPKID